MATQRETTEFILEQLQGAGETRVQAMFGEYALYLDGKVLGFICDDTLFLKDTPGARALIDPQSFPAHREGTPYMAPQVLIGVDHSMRFMAEESFAPAVGIMSVKDDAEAVRLMNDSRYGLTASIWSDDADQAVRLGEQLETGTCYLNRCDYLDPALAWTGVKDSGRGCTLSSLGYESLTRPKSFHLKLPEI